MRKRVKKSLSFLVALVMIASLFCSSGMYVDAEDAVPGTTADSDGGEETETTADNVEAEENVITDGNAQVETGQEYALTEDEPAVQEYVVSGVYAARVAANVTIEDNIKASGVLKAVVTGGSSEGITYQWYKSTDNAEWTAVERIKVTGESYNISEDGSELNVALDGGARAYYKVDVLVNGEVAGTSNTYQVPYYAELQNGSFETPNNDDYTHNSSSHQYQYTNGTEGLVWLTTGVGTGSHQGDDIEIIRTATTDQQDNASQYHNCRTAQDGVQYAELNCEASGSLYQDVLTSPSATLYWQLYHRARGTANQANSSNTKDTMYVLIMSTTLAEQYGITTQEKVNQVINNLSDYPGAKVWTIIDDNKAWYKWNGSYVVPTGQYLTRFFFVAGTTASNDDTVGNLLDNVWFDDELPPPEPDKGNLTIHKEVAGVDQNTTIPKEAFTFTIKNSQGEVVNTMKLPDENNSYTGALMNLPPGEYTIEESVTEDLENFALDTTTWNEDTENLKTTTIQIIGNATSSVNCKNTYKSIKGNLLITKKVTGLGFDDVKDKVTFTYQITGGKEETVKLSEFTDSNNDGVYEYLVEGLNAGSLYSVKEKNAEIAGYDLSTKQDGMTVDETKTYTIPNGDTVTAAFENQYTLKMYTLTVEKEVTGNAGDKNQNFDFTLDLKKGQDAYNEKLEYSKNGTTLELERGTNGVYEFRLKDNEKIEVSVPYGYTYTVSEDSRGYDVQINGESKSSVSAVISDNATLKFTNTKNIKIPTGVVRTMIPYMLMVIAALGIVAFKVIRSKGRLRR